MSIVFSRETQNAWQILFSAPKARGLIYSLIAILLHVILFLTLANLPQKVVDLTKIKAGESPISVRLTEGQKIAKGVSRPALRRAPQIQTKREPLVSRPLKKETVLTQQESPFKVLQPAAPSEDDTSLKQKWQSSPKLRQLLPNYQKDMLESARSYGEQWGQANDAGGNGDSGQAVDVQTREFKYASYFSGLIRQIEQVWVYPQFAARAGMQGQAIYDIVLNRDGTLQKLVSVQSTGYGALDDEVERAVRAAGPYNPVPSRIDKDPLIVRIRFVYTLTHFGIF